MKWRVWGEAVKKISSPPGKFFFQGEFSSQHTTEAEPSTPLERPKNFKPPPPPLGQIQNTPLNLNFGEKRTRHKEEADRSHYENLNKNPLPLSVHNNPRNLRQG